MGTLTYTRNSSLTFVKKFCFSEASHTLTCPWRAYQDPGQEVALKLGLEGGCSSLLPSPGVIQKSNTHKGEHQSTRTGA